MIEEEFQQFRIYRIALVYGEEKEYKDMEKKVLKINIFVILCELSLQEIDERMSFVKIEFRFYSKNGIIYYGREMILYVGLRMFYFIGKVNIFI